MYEKIILTPNFISGGTIMEKVVDLDSHRKDEIANEDELDNELSDMLKDLSKDEMCEPTEELIEEENIMGKEEEAKTSMAEDLEKIFDGFTSKINSEEFSEKLADNLYLNLFGQKSFDRMKTREAKKEEKAEARMAKKEALKSAFNDFTKKVSDTIKTRKKKTVVVTGLVLCFLMGVGYSLSKR